ncbi:two-component response regulator-like PRR37 isoform X2 [Physcomitrium patens]|uniref:Circadian response regulator 1a n=2 Tax=Physcomitrium patens TaxID=3218 RepID=E9RFF7_PHYPA|nr:two-component response regulator-like PRR37 isoform X2 [Physcomitrium patens]XP_024365932.1 two-component response regulator-like PRR37 isoform X2 [Physcomitrium patens]BAJ83826.1 circadian response regulator 1a [Physcomitrium patens]|eukprot:XP_024365931.1 two-component response regulator-like PRR37 isoform X2 [Physcomitrella patens]
MTGDSCKAEPESRPLRPLLAGGTACAELNVEAPVGAEWRIKGGYKAHKEVDRGREQVGSKVAEDSENGARLEKGRNVAGRSAVSVLKTREDLKDIAEQIRRELDHQFPGNDVLRTSESDDDGRRDGSAEDHYEEGDAVAAVARDKARSQGIARTKEQQQHGGDVAAKTQGGVGWESFLLKRSLRILLVEYDDATRHVVGALLRNCDYEVTAVANGSIAWGLLEDANSNFDLVLTDVVMPRLSGVGLLSKMMKREACRRVPIVIMSSYDSLDIVFRCLSKGACDYLVKPVRKNELRNLWQHVWRKCHSSSGSKSGSGSQTGEVARPQSRGVEADDNPSGSNDGNGSSDGSDNGSSRLNAQGGSDNGSGNQARTLPVLVPMNNAVTAAADGDEEGQATSQETGANLDEEMGHDLEMATRRSTCNTAKLDQQPDVGRQQDDDDACVMQDVGPSPGEDNVESPSTSGKDGTTEESSLKAVDLINGIACQPQTQGAEQAEGSENDDGELDQRGRSSPKDHSGSDFGSMLELSLKRPRSAVDNDGDTEERQPLRHSGGSAFSRYGSGGTIIQQCHQPGNSLPVGGYPMSGGYGVYGMSGGTSGGSLRLGMGMERCGSSKGSAEGTTPPPLHPQSAEAAGGQDGGGADGYGSARQSAEEAMIAPGVPMAIPIPPPGMLAYDGMGGAYGPAMHPMYYAHASAWMAASARHMGERVDVYSQTPAFQEQNPGSGHHSQAGPSHQHTHHHHGDGGQPSGNAGVQHEQQQSVITPMSGAPRCGSTGVDGQSGSSNGYGSTGNGNGSMNGSASGSNTGVNNGQNGLVVTPMANANSGNNGVGGTHPAMDGVSGGNGLCTEQIRFARREAALNKFRQKRKERCFEKKVRYQSRKKLAEQRPRVRGLFVRQAAHDPSAGDAE